MPNALSPECFFPLNNLLNHESTFYSPAIGEAVFFVFENHKILSKRAQVIVQKRVDISDLIIKLFFF